MARRLVVKRAVRLHGRRIGYALPNVGEKEQSTSNILFSMLQDRAKTRHWKEPFEVSFILASRETGDRPVPKDAVQDLVRALLSAINFFHAGAVVIDLEAMQAKPHRGEPAAYASFDGYKLIIGSTGYAAW